MAENLNLIKKETLDDIGDAIRIFHLKRNNFIGDIPVLEWATALRYGVVYGSSPPMTEELYKIYLQTLIDLADVVRLFDGSTDLIDVSELKEKIINLAIRLSKPEIQITFIDVEIVDDLVYKPKELNEPKILLYNVNKNIYEDITSRPTQLLPPEINLVSIDVDIDDERVESDYTQLLQPGVDLIEIKVSVKEENYVGDFISLTKPNVEFIEIEREVIDDDVIIKPGKIDAPSIKSVSIDVEIEDKFEQNLPKIDKPEIEIVHTDIYFIDVEIGSKPKKLIQPKLTMIVINFGDEPGVENPLIELDVPYIELTEVNKEIDEVIKPILLPVSTPKIRLVDVSKEEIFQPPEFEPQLPPLTQPSIYLNDVKVNVSFEDDEIYEKLNEPIIERFDVDVEIVEQVVGTTPLAKPIITLGILERGLSKPKIYLFTVISESEEECYIGYCIQLKKPSIELAEFYVTITDVNALPLPKKLNVPKVSLITNDVQQIPEVNIPVSENLKEPIVERFTLEIPVFDDIVGSSKKLHEPIVKLVSLNVNIETEDGLISTPTKLDGVTITLIDTEVFFDEETVQGYSQLNKPDIESIVSQVDINEEDFINKETKLRKPDVVFYKLNVGSDGDVVPGPSVEELLTPEIESVPVYVEIKQEETFAHVLLPKPHIIFTSIKIVIIDEEFINYVKLDIPTVDVTDVDVDVDIEDDEPLNNKLDEPSIELNRVNANVIEDETPKSKKLDKPIVQFVSVNYVGTRAILGIAILGKTILGNK